MSVAGMRPSPSTADIRRHQITDRESDDPSDPTCHCGRLLIRCGVCQTFRCLDCDPYRSDDCTFTL